MGSDRSRILVALAVYVGLVIASTLVLDWFVLTIAAKDVTLGIGLRTVSLCQGHTCVSESFGRLASMGNYPLAATITFWGTMASSVLVLYVVALRVLSEVHHEALARTGTIAAIVMILAAGVAGFVLAPGGSFLGSTLERTWAPLLLIVAHVVGIVVLRLAVAPAAERPDERANPAAFPAARAQPRDTGAPAARAAAPSTPRSRGPSSAPGPAPALPAMPEHLRKQIRYTVLGAELTRAGIDARREDGSPLLVLWRDVVGVVARRLPPEHDGATFVDIVSTAGATLRVLPWTRLTGDPVAGAGDDRARSVISLVIERCPQLQVDAVTREFLDGREPPRQLPDAKMLAAHDTRLA